MLLISRPSAAGKQAYLPLVTPAVVDTSQWSPRHWQQHSMDEESRNRSSMDEGPALSPSSSGEFYDPSYSVWPGEIRRSSQTGRRPPRIIKPGVPPAQNPDTKP